MSSIRTGAQQSGRTVDGEAVNADLDGDEATEGLLLDGVAALEGLVVAALFGGLLRGSLGGALLNDGASDDGSGEGGNGEDGELHVDCGWGFWDWKSEKLFDCLV